MMTARDTLEESRMTPSYGEEAAQYYADKDVTASLTGVVQPPSETDPPRVGLLRRAAQLITGDRESDYGPPSENFARIADMWNVQFSKKLAPGVKFTPQDAALGMLLVKLARAVETPTEDSFVDAAGYVALAYELGMFDGE